MSIANKVAWSEGLFMKPQHFQQESRYQEAIQNKKFDSISDYLYGLQSIEISNEYLNFGKIVIVNARGVMPDGTPFDIPLDCSPPEPLSIDEISLIGKLVYLAIPMRSDGILEMQRADSGVNSRFVIKSSDIKDIHSVDGNFTNVDMGQLNCKLLTEDDDRSAYSCIAIARIKDKRQDKSVVLEEQSFYPTSVSINAMPMLKRFIGEVAGLMKVRAKGIADRIGSPSQAGVADVTDFMFLQTLNKYHPIYNHLSKLRTVHPELIYVTLLQTAGELATFSTQNNRLPDDFPTYDHENPMFCFGKVQQALREILSEVSQPKAISIPIVKKSYGIYTASVGDKQIIASSDFILAVKANMPMEAMRVALPQQSKIASLEKINELVNLQLPGIPINLLPVAPRQLPYHSGYAYFQVDQSSPIWHRLMQDTNGFGLHIAGDFKDLDMQLWAIKQG
jgi:type VI secretion system protein ImpJ